ncbi:MAG: outer membrane protein assembly factor BamE [Planctomycetes bacterium]|nr:outer membrane protein assembly factor BamE [Planctomycetota bacterium]MCB9908872.1 outer membrane protein assembly factor BamE [Planctomycetota bacterium]HPF14280.1 outer membrane protein assembly factor BamE [Planctomycetota bacterium]HRV81536.1 outer membrane protein assembly factor BamE [Planctomycetota bacterium]
MTFLRSLLVASALLGLSGCFLSRSDVNEPIPRDAVQALKPGETTAGQVTQALGAPVEVVQLGRRSAYRYEYERIKMTGFFAILVGLRGVDQRSDRVWVFFDENDVLTHVGSTFEGDRAEYELPYLGEND